MNILAILILSILKIVAANALGNDTDYCKLGCVDPKKKHAVCENSKLELIENCPGDTKIMSLDNIQSEILKLHNERREFVASGKDAVLPPAARMGVLFWDAELARLAEYSVRRCLISDPHCYTTPSLPNPGRSANIYKYEATEVPFEELVHSRIVEWLETATDCTAEMAAVFPEKPPGHIDFFGRAITDSNNQVGCAASEWVKNSDKSFLLVCLYTNDVQAGRRLYRFGSAATKCQSGVSSVFKKLCSDKENYNVPDAVHKPRKVVDYSYFYKNGPNYKAPEGSLWQMGM